MLLPEEDLPLVPSVAFHGGKHFYSCPDQGTLYRFIDAVRGMDSISVCTEV